ncbi:alpha/beta hydrolase-fold protein [Micromonospora pallida]|nr:alpha/beta hydrolase-fold protein [Micromonospora pallida]
MLIALLFVLAAWSQPSAAAVQPVKIHVHYDTGWGNSLTIRGSAAPLSWTTGTAMTWTSGNVWVWEAPSTLQSFEFKLLINDTKWSTGSNYKVTTTSPRSIHVYPFFGAAQGRMASIANFFSPQLNNYRNIILYLPPSYSENAAKRYPVMYMHDGQNLFNAQTAFGGVEWQVDETLNRLIGQGTVRETIVVGIYNTANRMSEYTPSVDPQYGGGNANAYLDFIQQTLKPYINANYRTLTATQDTMMMGSSLGGLLSCYAGWTRNTVYGGVGCMSSSFWWDGEEFTRTVEAHQGKKGGRFYMDAGGNNDGATQTARFRDAMLADGYTSGSDLMHVYDPSGSHNESSWARRLPVPLEFLLPVRLEIRTQ